MPVHNPKRRRYHSLHYFPVMASISEVLQEDAQAQVQQFSLYLDDAFKPYQTIPGIDDFSQKRKRASSSVQGVRDSTNSSVQSYHSRNPSQRSHDDSSLKFRHRRINSGSTLSTKTSSASHVIRNVIPWPQRKQSLPALNEFGSSSPDQKNSGGTREAAPRRNPGLSLFDMESVVAEANAVRQRNESMSDTFSTQPTSPPRSPKKDVIHIRHLESSISTLTMLVPRSSHDTPPPSTQPLMSASPSYTSVSRTIRKSSLPLNSLKPSTSHTSGFESHRSSSCSSDPRLFLHTTKSSFSSEPYGQGTPSSFDADVKRLRSTSSGPSNTPCIPSSSSLPSSSLDLLDPSFSEPVPTKVPQFTSHLPPSPKVGGSSPVYTLSNQPFVTQRAARSVTVVNEHGQLVSTPLADLGDEASSSASHSKSHSKQQSSYSIPMFTSRSPHSEDNTVRPQRRPSQLNMLFKRSPARQDDIPRPPNYSPSRWGLDKTIKRFLSKSRGSHRQAKSQVTFDIVTGPTLSHRISKSEVHLPYITSPVQTTVMSSSTDVVHLTPKKQVTRHGSVDILDRAMNGDMQSSTSERLDVEEIWETNPRRLYSTDRARIPAVKKPSITGRFSLDNIFRPQFTKD